MLYYNISMSDAAPAPAPSRAAMRENARAITVDARIGARAALRMSAWGRLAMVSIVALALWAGVYWALN